MLPVPRTVYLLRNVISTITCSKSLELSIDNALCCLFAKKLCGLYVVLACVAEENIARVEEAREALVAYSALRADNSKKAKKTTKTNTTEKQFLQDID